MPKGKKIEAEEIVPEVQEKVRKKRGRPPKTASEEPPADLQPEPALEASPEPAPKPKTKAAAEIRETVEAAKGPMVLVELAMPIYLKSREMTPRPPREWGGTPEGWQVHLMKRAIQLYVMFGKVAEVFVTEGMDGLDKLDRQRPFPEMKSYKSY